MKDEHGNNTISPMAPNGNWRIPVWGFRLIYWLFVAAICSGTALAFVLLITLDY